MRFKVVIDGDSVYVLGDRKLDRAATVLRLVHINQLRELQTASNDIVRLTQATSPLI